MSVLYVLPVLKAIVERNRFTSLGEPYTIPRRRRGSHYNIVTGRIIMPINISLMAFVYGDDSQGIVNRSTLVLGQGLWIQ